MRESYKSLLFFPALIIGILGLVALKQGAAQAPRVADGERATPVRVIQVETLDVVPQAVGYGSSRPARVWQAVSEVAGRVVAVHPKLKAGHRVIEGEELLRIAPEDYQLALRQSEANIQATRAQLDQLQAQEENYRAALKIERQVLATSVKELERKRALAKQGSISRNELDTEERAYLAQKQKVQNQENSLRLLPAERAAKQAQLAQQQAQLEQARLNLERTVIRAPFTGRLAEVAIEQSQYVRQGEILLTLDDMAQAEVTAQVPVEHFAQILPQLNLAELLKAGVQPGPEMFQLQAEVSMQANAHTVTWPARFVRTSAGIDPQTRTVGVVVAVDKPYENALPPLKPPLVKGMYVAVTLRGAEKPAQIAIPRHALHGDAVYLADAEQRLQIRKVDIGLRQPGLVTVTSGLQAGQRLVVSDLVPAIEGMLLHAQEDEGAAQELRSIVR